MKTFFDLWPDEFKQAPSFYSSLPDDGASMECSECGWKFNPTELIQTFTPDGSWPAVLCHECVDPWWLDHAVDMGGKK